MSDPIDPIRNTYDRYTYSVTWSPDDGEFVATVAELPLLSSLSDDPLDAISDLRGLVRLILKEPGHVTPAPIGPRKPTASGIDRDNPRNESGDPFINSSDYIAGQLWRLIHLTPGGWDWYGDLRNWCQMRMNKYDRERPIDPDAWRTLLSREVVESIRRSDKKRTDVVEPALGREAGREAHGALLASSRAVGPSPALIAAKIAAIGRGIEKRYGVGTKMVPGSMTALAISGALLEIARRIDDGTLLNMKDHEL